MDSMGRQQLLQFLMGLSDSYGQARSQILMMNPPLSVNQCYAMIVQDESQRALSGEFYGEGENIDPTALLTSRSGGYTFGGPGSRSRGGRGHGQVQRRGLYCDHCDMKGHTRDDCNKLKHCTHCNMQGHTKEIYFQLIGYHPDWKGKKRVNMTQASHRLQDEGMRDNCYHTPQMQALQRPGGASSGDGPVPHFTPNQYNQILQMLNKSNTNESSANMTGIFAGTSSCNDVVRCCFNWIVDSGATNHMVSSKTLLNRDSTVNPGKVQIATGDSATITHSGSSQLTGGEVIEDVFCVPEFKFNLLSGSLHWESEGDW